ncbi:hypothetical protein [Nocardia beijingensis]
MTDMKIDIVMTTIGSGEFLDDFADIMKETSARLIVIPDDNTPTVLYDRIGRAIDFGMNIVCPSMAQQDEFLRSVRGESLVARKSDSRRNIGYLLAYRDGADLLISMDDDNLPHGPEFLRAHQIVADDSKEYSVINSSSRWFNPCQMLDTGSVDVYARGFPYFSRARSHFTKELRECRIAVNAGLWLGDPDVDAITRVAQAPVSTALNGRTVVLGPNTWAPVNSQNTAIAHRAVPAYYFPRMAYQVGERRIDRFADIFSGLFVQACAKAMGEAVAFGDPLTDHQRNEHDLLNDLDQELPFIRILEDISFWLTETRLTATESYSALYVELADLLDDQCEGWNTKAWSHGVRSYVHEMCYLMRAWARVTELLG